MDLTNKEFQNLPVGQKFIESCCSGTEFVKAVKISDTEIEKLSVDAHDFTANLEVKVFNPEFDWLETVNEFQDINEKVSSFEELKNLFGC